VFTTHDAYAFLSSLEEGSRWKYLQRDTYGNSYRALINLAAASIDDPQNDSAIALACAVYGWMPTILKEHKIKIGNINSRFPLQEIKMIESWKDAETFLSHIDEIAPINGSWVGTSKFLHFLNPYIFPIWDSRVAVSFHSKISIQAITAAEQGRSLSTMQLNYFCNRKDHYLEYTKFMLDFKQSAPRWVTVMQNEIGNQHKHCPTELRCLELVLFNRYSVNSSLEKGD
jgi:hypothetical protein